jgi:hypothetical protein
MEDMYSKEEIRCIIDDLSRVAEATVRQDMGMIVNMSSLLITQLLEGAEGSDISLSINPSIVEDKGKYV